MKKVSWKDDKMSIEKVEIKKVKIDYKPTLTFWNNATQSETFHSNTSELDFTSCDIENIQSSSEKSVKFIIRKINSYEDHITLEGDDVICEIYGEWKDLKYETNTKISVIKCYCCYDTTHNDEDDSFFKVKEDKIYLEVSDKKNLLFIEDDLITITNLISSIRCINRYYINTNIERLSFNFSDKSLVNGIILHSILEKAICTKNFEFSYIVDLCKEYIKDNLFNIYACNTTEKIVLQDILLLIKNISTFEKFNLELDTSEARVVSLIMNLKGNIDAIGNGIVLEIKSGKYSDVSHKAQVLLYSLMMKEKYKREFKPYVYYIGNKNLLELDIKHNEIRSLMILRNKLALYETIQECDCSGIDPCKVIFNILTLNENHFLKKMWLLIDQEENYRMKETWHPVKFKKQVDNVVVFYSEALQIDDPYINIYSKDLVKLCKGIIDTSRSGEHSDFQIKHQDAVLNGRLIYVGLSENINLEKNTEYFISFRGSDLFFKFVRYSLVYICYFRFVNRDYKNGFKLPGEEHGLRYQQEDDECSIEDVYEDIFTDDEDVEVSKIEVSDSNTRSNGTLLESTFDSSSKNNSFKNSSIQNINIGSSSSFLYFTPPKEEKEKFKYQIPFIYKKEFLNLNENQRSALYLALNCNNYRLVHGLPGTGKSSVIILLIKILVHLEKKILLVCYTNLAISNILKKLPNIRFYRAKKEKLTCSTTEEIAKYYKNIDLVASTCFGFGDSIFLEREFDFCIIDEGSQQHLLLTLIPISLCSKFVIFGDHLQLSPLVKSSKELGISLFEYLLDENHSELTLQYRMGPNIMRLPNTLFYNGKMQLGVESEDEVTFIDSNTIVYKDFIREVKNSVILCYFNSQVSLTKRYTNCQVETVDRFQGSEFDNIIVVFDPITKCEVMESKERLNVALTRAKKKLILVGDKRKMEEIDILKQLLSTL